MARIKIGEKNITSIPVSVKGIDKEKKTLTIVASSEDVDRHGDTIIQSGWDLKAYKKNPVILNSHRYDDATEVIAKATKTWIEGKGKKSKLLQTWEFAVEENPKAEIIFNLYAGGFLHASSVGFIVRKFKEDKNGSVDYFTIEEAELLEVSAVSVPANAAATLAKSIGASVKDLEAAVTIEPEEEIEEAEDEAIDPEDVETAEAEDPETPGDDEEDGAGEKDDEEEIEPEEDADELDIAPENQPEPVRSVKPKLTKRQRYARAIHKLNADQEKTLRAVSATIEKMLNGESEQPVKRDYNSIIRKLLKSK